MRTTRCLAACNGLLLLLASPLLSAPAIDASDSDLTPPVPYQPRHLSRPDGRPAASSDFRLGSADAFGPYGGAISRICDDGLGVAPWDLAMTRQGTGVASVVLLNRSMIRNLDKEKDPRDWVAAAVLRSASEETGSNSPRHRIAQPDGTSAGLPEEPAPQRTWTTRPRFIIGSIFIAVVLFVLIVRSNYT